MGTTAEFHAMQLSAAEVVELRRSFPALLLASILENARRLGHSTHTVAAAISLSTGAAAWSLCCWCLESADPFCSQEAHRVPAGGECLRCSYAGRDCLVVTVAR